MIPLFKVHKIEYSDLLKQTLESGFIGEGDIVQDFKLKLQNIFEHKNLIPTNSCTSAIKLSLKLLNLQPGDEVISSPYTMIASNSVVLEYGCKIAWCDVDEETLCPNIIDIIKIANEKTKAIIIPLIGGLVPNHFEQIFDLKIPIILDCAQAFMTYYRNQHISCWGDFACFSFQAIKHLTTGDGGCLSINYGNPNPLLKSKNLVEYNQLTKRAELLKWFGIARIVSPRNQKNFNPYDNDVLELGYKLHMNNIAAAIGITNLPFALESVKKSQHNAEIYNNELNSCKNISILNTNANSIASYWVYGIIARYREKLMQKLEENLICSSPVWKRNDFYTCFKLEKRRKFSILDRIHGKILFVPNGWWLDEKDILKISKIIKEN